MMTEDECDYDVMICFNENSDEDLNWVKDDLLVNIEGGEYNSMNFDDPDDRVSVIIRWGSDSKLGLFVRAIHLDKFHANASPGTGRHVHRNKNVL